MTLRRRTMVVSGGRHRMMLCKFYVEPPRVPVSCMIEHGSGLMEQAIELAPLPPRMSNAARTELYELTSWISIIEHWDFETRALSIAFALQLTVLVFVDFHTFALFGRQENPPERTPLLPLFRVVDTQYS